MCVCFSCVLSCKVLQIKNNYHERTLRWTLGWLQITYHQTFENTFPNFCSHTHMSQASSGGKLDAPAKTRLIPTKIILYIIYTVYIYTWKKTTKQHEHTVAGRRVRSVPCLLPPMDFGLRDWKVNYLQYRREIQRNSFWVSKMSCLWDQISVLTQYSSSPH